MTLALSLVLGAADASINLDTTNLSFTGPVGGPNPTSQTLNVTNSGDVGSTLAWTAMASKPWFQVSPAGGSVTTGSNVLTILAVINQPESWTGTSTTTGAPSARFGHTAVWTGKKMIVWGGYAAGTYTNTGGIYDPAADSWTATTTTNAPSSRRFHAAVWTGSKMILWGGEGSGGQVNTGAAYDPIADSWSTISTTNAPSARAELTAVWDGTEMIVWGGVNSTTKQNTGGRYNPGTDSWTSTSTTGATARTRHTAVWTGSRMIVWGGLIDPSTTTRTGALYDPVTDSWTGTTTLTNAPTSRFWHSAVWNGSEMIVWGGSGFLTSGGRYDPATNTWNGTTPTGVPFGLYQHSAIWSGVKMMVWGGYNGTSHNEGSFYFPPINLSAGIYNETVAVTDPSATNTPQTIAVSLTVQAPTINLTPTARNFTVTAPGVDPAAQTATLNNSGPVGTTLQWTATSDQRWLSVTPVSGSTTNGTDTLTIQTHLQGTEQWQPGTMTTNAPVGKISHSAVWTGSQMIIWGGEEAFGTKTSAGKVYTPDTDTWTAMAGFPANVRLEHSTVWTGTEMIVWGGDSGASILGDGARYNPTTNTWTLLSTTGAPTARHLHSAIWTGSKMIIWGGKDAGYNSLNNGGIYDPGTNTWTTISTVSAPDKRDSHTAVWTGSKMIVWGGKNSGFALNSGGIYDPITNSWSPVTTNDAPTARAFHVAFWTGSKMLVWGGREDFVTRNTGGIYDPSTDSWIPTAMAGAPTATDGFSGVWTGSEMIIWGGDAAFNSGAWGFVNTGAIFDPATNHWSGTTTTTGAPEVRAYHSAVWTGTKMLVWGGIDSFYTTYFQNGGIYEPAFNLVTGGVHTGHVTISDPNATNNPQSVTVTLTLPAPTIQCTPSALNFAATSGGADPASQTCDVTNTGSGGSTLTWAASSDRPWLTVSPTFGTVTNDTGTLTVQTSLHAPGRWTSPISSINEPVGRLGAAMVWTGSEMIVWGGYSSTTGYLDNGGRYNPATDTWTSMSMTNAPGTRVYAKAVWTGSKMIVWGGDFGGSLGDGGIYDPATDSWSAISTINAPSARSFYQAIWTGSKMIVWGGAAGYANDGGLYDPNTDSWSAMTTTNAPVGRGGHSAVWTGAKMIVWGGQGSSGYLNDGGIYDPVANSWSALSTTGAPTPRFRHVAVWTGTRMLVWAGYGFGECRDGGSYDPQTDSWTSLATTNSPYGGQDCTAVWTGSKMVVWGGAQGTMWDIGGVYDPVGNSWTPTTTINAPNGRYLHSAVWTGTKMLVWGGTGIIDTLANGGCYELAWDLSPGIYTGHIAVTGAGASNSPQTITVTLEISPPTIQVNPSTLTFNTAVGTNPPTQTSNLTNPSAGSTLNWSAQSDAIWLNATPTNGTITTGTTVLTFSPKAVQTDSWPGTASTTGAPNPREAMSVVWTGNEMIVWGGWADAVQPNGRIYNPVTDSWRSIRTSGAPQVAKHVAVWTGSKMIVWGGMNAASGYVNTGAAYNPATDTWSAISNANAPSGRWHPAVCWTGTEMIIWGGKTSGTCVNTGGRYNPVTDTWSVTPTSTSNAPSARFGASGIWTGTEMIVWGGTTDDGVTGLQDGGRYNPGTDSWVAGGGITATGAPTARYHHTAVWDGTHMIVWGGGSDLDTRLNTGALYDPASDTWIGATTGTGAPAIRQGHGAIWTGNEMIIWGGWWGSPGPGHLRFNDGPRYRPAFNLAAGSYTGHLTVSDPAASNNPQQVTVTLNVTDPPTIDSAAAASPNPVTSGTTTDLSVYASDADAYPSALSYTWSVVSGPGGVSFSPNGTPGSNASTATFPAQGDYTLRATVSDGAASVTSDVAVTVSSAALPTAGVVQSVAVSLVGTNLQVIPTIVDGSAALLPGANLVVNMYVNGVFWKQRVGTTLANGTVTFLQAGPPAGTLTAKVVGLTRTGTVWDGTSPVGSVVRTASITAVVQSVAVSLVSGNLQVKPTIVDGSAAPLGGASVTVNMYVDGVYWRQRIGTTLADGTVTFLQVSPPAGTLTAKVVVLTGPDMTWSGSSPVGSVVNTASISSTVQSVSVSLVGANQDLQVKPKIVDGSNNPLAGLSVLCYIYVDGVFWRQRTGTTLADGTVTFLQAGPPAGTLLAKVAAVSGTNTVWDGIAVFGSVVKTASVTAVVQTVTATLVNGGADLRVDVDIVDGGAAQLPGVTVTCNMYVNGVYWATGYAVTNASGHIALLKPSAPSGTLTAKVVTIAAADTTWDGTSPVGTVIKP